MTGSGTELDPYIITTVDDLQAMENDLTAYYELGGDIDASATSGWNGGEGFVPISYFEGQLDGKGYSISSLFIDRASNEALFEYVEGVVQNLGLTNCHITGRVVSPFTYYNYGTITKCYATGAIVGERISLSFLSSAAGFAIRNYGTIENCYSRCSVQGDLVAGFVLENRSGAISENCYSTGLVTGYTEEIDYVYPSGDYSNVGSWIINPDDGVFWDKLLTNDGDTTYIQAQTNDCLIFFTFPFDVPLAAVMRYLRIALRIRNTASGTSYEYRVTRIGDVDYNDVGGSVSTQSYFVSRSPASAPNPATGETYLLEDVNGGGANAIQAMGFRVTDAAPDVRATEVWVEVYYLMSSTRSGFCFKNEGTITNCFWDTETSGQATSDGGTGKTTAEMKTQSTFTDAGWDFTTPIWTIQAEINDGYPSFAATLFKALVLYLELSLLDRCQYAIFNSRSITLAIRN